MKKKIIMLVITIMMIVASVFNAFAAASTSGTTNAYNGIETTENVLNITKEIVFINDEDTAVREPNIVYTYTVGEVQPGSAAITSPDENNIPTTISVKAGPLSAVTGNTTATTSEVSFTDIVTSNANAAGISNTKNAVFTFDPAQFQNPGIYRYSLVESTNVNKNSVGIVEQADYSATRFLDVYVHWNNDNLEIYGYVLYEGTQSDSITYDSAPDLAKKSPGYIDMNHSDGLQDVDTYTTENLYINKAVTGSLADRNNDFPIHLTLTAPAGLSDVKLDVTTSNNGTLNVSNDTIGSHIAAWGTVDGTVRNDSQIVITGIPTGATLTVTETNNTLDSYRVKAGTSSGADDLLSENTVAGGATSASSSALAIDKKSDFYLTNSLNEISPTGYSARFAPYGIMLGGGIALFAILKYRNKNREQ